MKIRALLLAIALLAGAALAGAADPRGELRVAIPWTPENLDPTMNLSSIRATVGVSIFDSLVGRDADNQHRPRARRVLEGARRHDVAAQAAPRRRVPQRRAVQRRGRALHLRARARPQPEVAQPRERGRGRAGRGASTTTRSTWRCASPTRRCSTGSSTSRSSRRSTPPRRATRAWRCGRWAPARSSFVELVKDDHLIVEAFDRHWRGAAEGPRASSSSRSPSPSPARPRCATARST